MAQILIFIQLPQDLDAVWPTLRKLPREKVAVLMTSEVRSTSPRLERRLREAGIEYSWYPAKIIRLGLLPRLRGVKALVCPSESSAGPHRIAHFLTRRANGAGIKTFTLQHGFDNVGLTYADREYPADSISLASQEILLWGERSTLHPGVPGAVRSRCVPVGLTKSLEEDLDISPLLEKDGRPVVALFENLHWARYEDSYRERFIDDIQYLVSTRKDVAFVLKPHHVGRWTRQGARLWDTPGLRILDPIDPRWEPFTAPALARASTAVITTPSTVALDAAVLRKPVAVVTYGMDLSRYEPLPFITSREDLLSFVDEATTNPTRLLEAAERFERRWVVPGDGASRASERILRATLYEREKSHVGSKSSQRLGTSADTAR